MNSLFFFKFYCNTIIFADIFAFFFPQLFRLDRSQLLQRVLCLSRSFPVFQRLARTPLHIWLLDILFLRIKRLKPASIPIGNCVKGFRFHDQYRCQFQSLRGIFFLDSHFLLCACRGLEVTTLVTKALVFQCLMYCFLFCLNTRMWRKSMRQ